MFRDEASCAGIKLNPLGQIRFVSKLGQPQTASDSSSFMRFAGLARDREAGLAGWLAWRHDDRDRRR